jgi:hypothetical protein
MLLVSEFRSKYVVLRVRLHQQQNRGHAVESRSAAQAPGSIHVACPEVTVS